MKIKVLKQVFIDAESYQPGSVVDVSDDNSDLAFLVRKGFVEEVSSRKAKKEKVTDGG